MPSVAASEHVPAPAHDVFAFMNVPANHARITPAITASREVGRMENGGAKAEYLYRLAAVPLRGTVEAVEFVPGTRLAFVMHGDIEGTIRLDFAEEAGGTRVTYAADYSLPGSRLLEAAGPLATAINSRVLKRTLHNLKNSFEG